MIQAKLFFIFLAFGILLGVIWGILNFIKLLLKNNIVVSQILEAHFAVVNVFGFFIALINFNFGEFRFYLLVAYVVGFILERKTLGKLFAKVYYWLYNKLKSGAIRLKKTKLVKRVLK